MRSTVTPRLVYIPGHQVAVVLSVSLPELDHHVAGRGAIGDLLVRLYHDNPPAAAPTVPGHSWVMWDLAPIAWLIDPSWVPTTDVDRATVGPHHRWATGEGTLTEAFRMDRRGVYTDFFRRLAERHPRP